MNINKLLFSASIFVAILMMTSCTESNTSSKQGQDEKLIAERLNPSNAKENMATITKLTFGDKGFSTLATAIDGTDFKDILNNEGPYTIFAPVNFAFEKLSESTVNKMLQPENIEELTSILNYHIIPSAISEEDIKIAIGEFGGSVKLKTLGGKKLTATLKDNRIFLIDEMGNGGKLITTDIEAANGILHTIDVVMMPKK